MSKITHFRSHWLSNNLIISKICFCQTLCDALYIQRHFLFNCLYCICGRIRPSYYNCFVGFTINLTIPNKSLTERKSIFQFFSYITKYISITQSTVKGGWKWRILKMLFFMVCRFLKILFLNFKTPVKYLEKQTELNNLCLYIKKYARIKKTLKNKKALWDVQNYQCKKLKTTFGSHFFTYFPILANFISKYSS